MKVPAATLVDAIESGIVKVPRRLTSRNLRAEIRTCARDPDLLGPPLQADPTPLVSPASGGVSPRPPAGPAGADREAPPRS